MAERRCWDKFLVLYDWPYIEQTSLQLMFGVQEIQCHSERLHDFFFHNSMIHSYVQENFVCNILTYIVEAGWAGYLGWSIPLWQIA